MTSEEILQKLYDETMVGNGPAVIELTNEGLEMGMEPETLLFDALIPSLEEVGARFERGDWFVPEMLIAGKAMAKEFKLPLSVSKDEPVATLGIDQDQLDHVVEHLPLEPTMLLEVRHGEAVAGQRREDLTEAVVPLVRARVRDRARVLDVGRVLVEHDRGLGLEVRVGHPEPVRVEARVGGDGCAGQISRLHGTPNGCYQKCSARRRPTNLAVVDRLFASWFGTGLILGRLRGSGLNLCGFHRKVLRYGGKARPKLRAGRR